MNKERIVFLDWLRVTACLMVIITHCTEPFYLGGDGTYIASLSDGIWCTLINAFVRSCVPLFVLTSSYLLFPVKSSTADFFKRRGLRVVLPLILWIIIYSLLYPSAEGAKDNLLRCFFGFPDPAGHLWFVYMLIGVYLLMPLLSPWAEKASRKELQLFLGLWFLTTTIPFLRQASVALFGTWAFCGEANWNEFGVFYYVSGFIGYLVLGYYLRREVPELSWKKTLGIAVPAFFIGYLIATGWFWQALGWDAFRTQSAVADGFPVNEPISLAVNMETSWRFCSIGVALMTVAVFLIFRKIKADGKFYQKIVLPVSKASYGVYLMHMVVLLLVHGWLRPLCEASMSPVLATPVCIFGSAIITYCSCCIIAVLVQKIPYIGKYIVG